MNPRQNNSEEKGMERIHAIQTADGEEAGNAIGTCLLLTLKKSSLDFMIASF